VVHLGQKDWDAGDLLESVTQHLLPYLRELDGTPQPRLISGIFRDMNTVVKSGFNLKDVIFDWRVDYRHW
jgi:hypothetical protein